MVRSKAYLFGMVFGIVTCGILFFVVSYLLKCRTGRGKREYDERQKLAQGTAYKYAFFTNLIYACAVGLYDQFTGVRWCDTMTCAFLGICVSTMVFAVICIFNDAYVSFQERPRNVYTIMGLLAAVNLASGVMNLLPPNKMVENGMLTFRCVNLVVAIMLITIIVMMAVKGALDRRGERDGQV
ncbi:MAG: hypothetical protein PHC80_03645 [Eubacteriales bacterium]|nr:hypothetical protein [Eubacteriales bacterium]